MKALSIKQPWAYLIVHGFKDIENRSWPTSYRGRIYVHAGQRADSDALTWLMEKGVAGMKALMLYSKLIPRGAIVGEVDIVDCVTQSSSLWFEGPIGFVLCNPLAYDSPIPYKGKLGLFDVDLLISKQGGRGHNP